MLNLFSAESAPGSSFPDEQLQPVLDALCNEGKAQDTLYRHTHHMEQKESYKYIVTTEITADTEENLSCSTLVEKFYLERGEFLEFVPDTPEDGLVPEKDLVFPPCRHQTESCTDHAEQTDPASCPECLRPAAEQHLHCISRIESLESRSAEPKKKTARSVREVKDVRERPQKTFRFPLQSFCLLFALCITCAAGVLLSPSLLSDGDQPAVLKLIFNVQDVSISIGEQEYRSPGNRLSLNLPAGRYRVRAEKSGYLPADKEIILDSFQVLPFSLQPADCLLTVHANLDQSTVLLNDSRVGTTTAGTPVTVSLPAGNHTVKVTNPLAAAPFQQDFHLTGNYTLKAVLPLPELTIQLNTDNVTVIADEKEYIAEKRQLTLNLPIGTHHISAQKEGYALLEKEVSINGDSELFLQLVQATYPLAILSTVNSTIVSVACNDEVSSSGIASPDVPFRLKVHTGTCTVSADKEGYSSVNATVTIPDKKTVTVRPEPLAETKTEEETSLPVTLEPEERKTKPSASKKGEKKNS
ncbi:MAG: PEGA domain-containing protein [Candidatus Electrothrix sp. YB6]